MNRRTASGFLHLLRCYRYQNKREQDQGDSLGHLVAEINPEKCAWNPRNS
jgi:hypothetical protein